MTSEDHNDHFTKELTFETKLGLGVLVGAAAVFALSAAYLANTPSVRRYRSALKDRVEDIRGDIEDQLRQLQRVDREVYFRVVDDVISRYQEMEEMDAEELLAFTKELKRHYSTIKREMARGSSAGGTSKKKVSSGRSTATPNSGRSAKTTAAGRKKTAATGQAAAGGKKKSSVSSRATGNSSSVSS